MTYNEMIRFRKNVKSNRTNLDEEEKSNNTTKENLMIFISDIILDLVMHIGELLMIIT